VTGHILGFSSIPQRLLLTKENIGSFTSTVAPKIMSAYYTFQPACNTIETGPEFPQVQKMAPGYNYKASNSVYALSKAVEKLPDFTPNLDHFVAHGKAKLTDLLSVASANGGFLISNRLKILLEKFNVAQHRFYPAKVSHKKELYEYYWMHMISDLTNLVDYPNSTFFIYYNYSHNLGYIPIDSMEDFKQQKEKVKKDNPDKAITIWAEKIKLNADSYTSLDLFGIGCFNANYYISERLKTAISTAGTSRIPSF
jgi:hypothetical protein